MQIEWSKCMRKGEFRLRNLSQSLLYYNSFRTTPRSFSKKMRTSYLGNLAVSLKRRKTDGPMSRSFGNLESLAPG